MRENKKKTIAIGADIGGSHISCAAVDMADHSLLKNTLTSIDVDNKASAETILGHWSEAIRQSVEKSGVEAPAGIGLAMPGPFDYPAGIGLFEGVDKFDHLNGVDVGVGIRERLGYPGDVPVRFMNDATSFAVGAVWQDPELAGKHVLAITLGTGFGSAFIFDSLPVLTDDRVPEMGCVYHLPYKDGIADDTFSTRGMIRAYLERSGHRVNGIKEIAERAADEEHAAATFRQYGAGLAGFLAPWIKRASITDIVMGGNVTRSYDLFREPFETTLDEHGIAVSVQISFDTEFNAILGSARLADPEYFERVKPLLKDM
jgi:glucokinase